MNLSNTRVHRMIEAGKAYIYTYDRGGTIERACMYCSKIANGTYTIEYVWYNPAPGHAGLRIDTQPIHKSFNEPEMTVEEIPLVVWMLCKLKGEYLEKLPTE